MRLTQRAGLRASDITRGLVALAAAALGLAAADALLDGLAIPSWGQLLLVAGVMALVGAVLRPVLVRLAGLFGWVGAVLLALLGQAVVVAVTLLLLPGVALASPWDAVWASWVVAAVTTLVGWLATAGTDDAVIVPVLRSARRVPPVDDPDVEGIVFVQLDGVPFPVLQLGVLGGTLPTLGRWIRSRSHRMQEWTPMLPATTPASQMGILHGTIDGIPAFRWLDRPTGRVFVANKPKDAADIEARHSDGRGLLADGGVSVSNLFSGDAPEVYATMSSLGAAAQADGGREVLNRFLARPEGFARGLVRSVAELGREVVQARRQVRLDLRPRVHRGLGFAAERSALQGVLRDFNTITVAEAMLRGARSIYVDYVDYDAMAHHAGILRAESLDALAGLDRVLAQLEQVAAVAPRRYRFVVLSDHGQSQGEVFADRYGESLAELVARLSGGPVAAATANTESSARLDATVGQDGVVTRTLRASGATSRDAAEAAEVAVDAAAAAAGDDAAPLLVFGSGNLGLVFVTGSPTRLLQDELAKRFPALVPGIVAHQGVSFVVVGTPDGPLVLGRDGRHHLGTGAVDGADPLAPFGPDAPSFVRRLALMPEAPDVLVNSLFDPETEEVAAFEGLVGCHGGLGGWQDRAMLVWPSDLPAPSERIVGADAMHRQLVAWLEGCGQRGAAPAVRR